MRKSSPLPNKVLTGGAISYSWPGAGEGTAVETPTPPAFNSLPEIALLQGGGGGGGGTVNVWSNKIRLPRTEEKVEAREQEGE